MSLIIMIICALLSACVIEMSHNPVLGVVLYIVLLPLMHLIELLYKIIDLLERK